MPRVSGRLGRPIGLNVRFYRDGVATDPFAIRRVRIYRSAVAEENLIDTIDFVYPDATDYPSPATQEINGSGPVPGSYVLVWNVPTDIVAPDIYFDVWDFLGDDCRSASSGATDSCLDDESLFISQCNQFWLYPDGWFVDDGLEVMRFGFEALDIKLRQPEIRTIEVGLMPLPLYDFDYNKIAPIVPQLKAYFSLESENCELLIEDAPMSIGIRQGSYRSNPFTLQFRFNTSVIESTNMPLLRGTYKYRVKIMLPNGETRVSDYFTLQVS